ncbi:23S rRNA (pseudouridine(1915)-N(3))-methyltransferase RlmH [Dialister succinatiphilus]|uniref:23S rRNA (pseudouridine(1915)-N(3))-methyltransferase RlmH n=1 Tax=Dialister succinatiphilus TaxID=487173 RepID=UPI002357E303|nr:23S rRNA (pseudouridine(1915)-N(3))-methyltransferase RlmH [Dialister succinatiphilus]
MKFTFLTIGKIKEKWMRQGIDEYLKRLSPIAKVEVLSPDEEKMPENPSPALKEKVMEKEGEKLLKYLKGEDFLILLDLKGKPVTSEELADILRKKMVSGTSHFFFMIGGPYGNGENIRRRANLKISISAMTFTHQMARLILAEQVYRAMKIIRHEPYHL